MSHAPHVRLTDAELNEATLKDAKVYGADEEKVGTVSHVHGLGAAAAVIIDVGGFLGIGAKPVSVPVRDLEFVRDNDGDVRAATTWTKDQLKDMPEHKH